MSARSGSAPGPPFPQTPEFWAATDERRTFEHDVVQLA